MSRSVFFLLASSLNTKYLSINLQVMFVPILWKALINPVTDSCSSVAPLSLPSEDSVVAPLSLSSENCGSTKLAFWSLWFETGETHSGSFFCGDCTWTPSPFRQQRNQCCAFRIAHHWKRHRPNTTVLTVYSCVLGWGRVNLRIYRRG